MRRTKRERVEAIWREVEREPGIRAGRVAKKLGVPRSSVTRALPTLEGQGMLLREDGRGRLFAWRRRK